MFIIEVHTEDGARVTLNPMHVVSVRETKRGRCEVTTTEAVLRVVEHYHHVQRMLEG